MTSPILLPEMLLYLAPLVALQDRLACARVCRQWYASFMPFIWSSFTVPENWASCPSPFSSSPSSSSSLSLSPTSSFPCLETLKKNAHYIRSLTLKATLGLEPFLRNCTSLKMLFIHGEHIMDPRPDTWDQLIDLIRHNPGIEWIFFGFNLTSAPSAQFLRALPEACPNLKRYESSRAKYDNFDQVEALIRVFSRLQIASSRFETFVNIQDLKRWSFPDLIEICLKDMRGFSPQSQVELISQCPNLQHLKWTMYRDQFFPVKEFCEKVPAACPHLTMLQMDGCGLRDPDEIGQMLDSLAPPIRGLELFSVCGTSISRPTFQSLSLHFKTLKSLDISYCSQVESWMAQKILEESPQLTRLLCPSLKMWDIVHGKDWAAKGMQHLEVNILQSSPGNSSLEEQWTTFRQLSKLTQLESLSIGSLSWTLREGLLFQMDSGVDQLRTLINLEYLNLGKSYQRMVLDDVIWMGTHLEKLKKIEGIFHRDWDKHLEMATKFKEFGVEVLDQELPPDYYFDNDSIYTDGSESMEEYEEELEGDDEDGYGDFEEGDYEDAQEQNNSAVEEDQEHEGEHNSIKSDQIIEGEPGLICIHVGDGMIEIATDNIIQTQRAHEEHN
ncbi:hypothetical protein BX616_003866 [Lobosporangium transversale]|uniref:F-box domain-containing protein n=1 Tax=Lobosporangium transversale TaxID=64571 RepID=A0A1Y2H115_9FUNG|nr:hypothetical protein BCR41DRAFT_347865 [Lobosporangium transversale]KAF9916398.1 hypothetical protein BX616_003866 [Lobosporangium transversale]ORZ26752.1 hypothetical protein BCR41DRAFT_347865 [Lobosporangium transversale]|eukprot:XP_021884515.1 hypothetical protein BCR41DRAFT_347865 [Lobosporangium transversale]